MDKLWRGRKPGLEERADAKAIHYRRGSSSNSSFEFDGSQRRNCFGQHPSTQPKTSRRFMKRLAAVGVVGVDPVMSGPVVHTDAGAAPVGKVVEKRGGAP